MPLKTEDINGFQVCAEKKSDVVNCVTNWVHADQQHCRFLGCLNPHSVEVAAGDAAFRGALKSADTQAPAGHGNVLASRILGGGIRERVTGMDVFSGVMSAMNARGGGSCFFLGSTNETLEKIQARAAEDFPNVKLVGVYSPPFKPEYDESETSTMIAAVNAAAPDVLWVGLTAPKQEKWISANRDRLNVRFAGAIGAVFDFYAGNVRRVSPFWQKLGFEWLPRLLQQPRRLWRRTFLSAPSFLIRTLRYRRRMNLDNLN